MRILAIAPQPFFTPRGTPFSVYYRTLVMAEHGHEVDVLTYGEGEDVAIPNVRVIRIPRVRMLEPIPVGPSAKKLALDVLMAGWTWRLLRQGDYDLVHAHEEAVIWCRWLKGRFEFPLVYDMHSSLPQQFRNFSFPAAGVIGRVFASLEKSALEASDAIVTICPALRDYVERMGYADRQFLIENSIFDPIHLSSSHNKVSSNGSAHRGESEAGDGYSHLPQRARYRILYAGTFEAYQGIDLLVRAFARVRERRDDVELVLLGGKADQIERVRGLAGELGAGDRCHLPGPLPKSLTAPLIQQADVLVSPRLRGNNTPLKVYELIASGRPVVATRVPSHTQVLSEEVCFLVEPEAAAMAEGLEQAISDREAARQRASAARHLYDREYARPVYERKVDELLELFH